MCRRITGEARMPGNSALQFYIDPNVHYHNIGYMCPVHHPIQTVRINIQYALSRCYRTYISTYTYI